MGIESWHNLRQIWQGLSQEDLQGSEGKLSMSSDRFLDPNLGNTPPTQYFDD